MAELHRYPNCGYECAPQTVSTDRARLYALSNGAVIGAFWRSNNKKMQN